MSEDNASDPFQQPQGVSVVVPSMLPPELLEFMTGDLDVLGGLTPVPDAIVEAGDDG